VRIQQFKENVASVRGYYKDVLHTVNGNQKKEAVFEAVVRALQGR
jgi:adenylate kinase family enzyme